MDFSAIIFNKAQVADIRVDIPHLVMQNKVFHPRPFIAETLKVFSKGVFQAVFFHNNELQDYI